VIPFSKDVYLRVVEQVNVFLWPGQIVALCLGAVVMFLCLRPRGGGSQLIAASLAAAWFLVGTVYYGRFFSPLNWAAWISAAAFVAQGLLLAWFGVARGGIKCRFDRSLPARIGIVLLVFALAVYPLSVFAAGVGWRGVPIVGVSPDATISFTLGVLLLTPGKASAYLSIIPLLAAFAGGAAAWMIGLPVDLVLLPVGCAALWLTVVNYRKSIAGSTF